MIDVLTLQELHKTDIEGYFPFLFEVYNPDIAWSGEEKSAYGQDDCYMRFVADDVRVLYKGKTWLPCNFEYTPPETDGTKVGSATISISALDSRVRQLLRIIRCACKIKIAAFFVKTEKEDTGKFIYKFKELNGAEYTMEAASSNRATATFNLVYKTSLGQAVPYDMATSDRVPGGGSQ